ncbi:MAG: hypothetical protein QM698_07815 [Micropepsaceae bacterium]
MCRRRIRAAAALAGALALAACSRGYDNPIVLGTLAAAEAVSGEDRISRAEENRLNAENQTNVARFRTLCAGIDTRLSDLPVLKANAPEVARLTRAIGEQILAADGKACAGFHAESMGAFPDAYRLYFGAAVESMSERSWIAEHGGTPKQLSDRLHYGVMNAILRLRAAGHATDIYHVGSERVTGYTCADLKREAPSAATCR